MLFLVVIELYAVVCFVELIAGAGGSPEAGERFAAALRTELPEVSGFALSDRLASSDVAYGERTLYADGRLEERIGDVSNVLFSNGWIADEDGTVYIYYASSDTRMHVAVSTIDKLVDYCMNTPADGLTTTASVETLKKLIDRNLPLLK